MQALHRFDHYRLRLRPALDLVQRAIGVVKAYLVAGRPARVGAMLPLVALLGWLAIGHAAAQPPAPPPPAPPPASQKVIVSDVIIQGNRLISTEAIRNQMRTRPGQEYIPDVLQEDVR